MTNQDWMYLAWLGLFFYGLPVCLALKYLANIAKALETSKESAIKEAEEKINDFWGETPAAKEAAKKTIANLRAWREAEATMLRYEYKPDEETMAAIKKGVEKLLDGLNIAPVKT